MEGSPRTEFWKMCKISRISQRRTEGNTWTLPVREHLGEALVCFNRKNNSM